MVSEQDAVENQFCFRTYVESLVPLPSYLLVVSWAMMAHVSRCSLSLGETLASSVDSSEAPYVPL